MLLRVTEKDSERRTQMAATQTKSAATSSGAEFFEHSQRDRSGFRDRSGLRDRSGIKGARERSD
jgi:hypothetical protein